MVLYPTEFGLDALCENAALDTLCGNAVLGALCGNAVLGAPLCGGAQLFSDPFAGGTEVFVLEAVRF